MAEGAGTVYLSTTLAGFVTLHDGSILSVMQFARVYLEEDTIVYELTDGKVVRDPQPTGTGATAYSTLTNALVGTPAIPPVSTTMQPYYGEADAPTVDPDTDTLPAFYRGRVNNTLWFWDTEQKVWFPVVST